MLDRQTVGARIRHVRTDQKKTLRDVENASGFSSTHISEIERGRTSPTIGALIQIAHALEKDPSYFIEERELDEVAVTQPDRRAVVDPTVLDIAGKGILVEGLTPGILGGRIHAYEVIMEPGGQGRTQVPENVDLCMICLEGGVEVRTKDRTLVFGREDSAHAAVPEPFEIHNKGPGLARILFLMDPSTTHI